MLQLSKEVMELVAASFLCVLEEVCCSCAKIFGEDEDECLCCLENLIKQVDE